jgi:hypothetical protein
MNALLLLVLLVILFLLNEIRRGVNELPISQQQFDQDLAALVTAIGTLITAFENWRASHPDLTAEDQSVVTAIQQVQTELNNIQPPPPPGP